MIVYHSNTNNPYVNIAAEEFFLRNFSDDVFFLYVNEPSVIVGKHQNTMAEINVPYIFQNNLKVVRRLSGGGTVYHDFGNLNYCFIKDGKDGHLVNFKKYSQPIIDALQQMGVNAYLRGKSDLVINGLKFSGNAEHVFKNRILHHGTLLFDSDLTKLNESIKADWDNFTDKAVRSNRSVVTNIINHVLSEMSLVDFEQRILDLVLGQNKSAKSYVLSENDEQAIQKLIDEKYGTWKWNFAYSPNYKFSKQVTTAFGILKADLEIKKGMVENVVFLLSEKTFHGALALEQLLQGFPHNYPEIKKTLESHNFVKLLFTPQELLSVLF